MSSILNSLIAVFWNISQLWLKSIGIIVSALSNKSIGRYNGSGFYQVDGGVDDRYSINGNLSALSPWSRWN